MRELWEKVLDWFLGPREWSVFWRERNGLIPAYAYVSKRTACDEPGEHLWKRGMRRKAAIKLAGSMNARFNPPPRHFNCRCTLTTTETKR